MNTEEAVARLRDLCGDGSLDDYWPSVRLGDIRALLDERDALRSRIQEQKAFIDADGNCENSQLILELVKERDALLAENEQLRVQLAGCSVAAFDGSEEQEAKEGAYGWSVAYSDVLNLRRKYDALRERLEAAEKVVNSLASIQAVEGMTVKDILTDFANVLGQALKYRERFGGRDE